MKRNDSAQRSCRKNGIGRRAGLVFGLMAAICGGTLIAATLLISRNS